MTYGRDLENDLSECLGTRVSRVEIYEEGHSTSTLLLTAVGCAALAAGLMYFLDPVRGNYRQKLIRDKLIHGQKVASRSVQKKAEDMKNRAWGTVASARSSVMPDHADDRTIAERIRAGMGRAVSHPKAIHVDVRDRVATLSGPVLASEVEQLLEIACSTRGVKRVENQLDVHEHADIPALQGGG